MIKILLSNRRYWRLKALVLTIASMFCIFPLHALDLTCVLPKKDENLSVDKNIFIKLLEPKTKLRMDKFGNIENFSSPNCNRFQSLSVFGQLISIVCESNDGDGLVITIDKSSKKFTKFETKPPSKFKLHGFCVDD